jgi:hypothetical protein
MSSTEGEGESSQADRDRRILATWVTVACVISAAILLWISFTRVELASILILQALASFSLATVVVLGARAIDGPIQVRSRRRGGRQQSDAASAVRLWISCFVVIEAVFFLAVLMGELDVYLWRADSADRVSRPLVKSAPAGANPSVNTSGEISPPSIDAGLGLKAVQESK